MNNKKLIIISSIILVTLFVIYLLTLLFRNEPTIETLRLKDEKTFYILQNSISQYLQEKDYNNPEFTLKKVYYQEDDLTTYYHANGYIIDIVMEDFTYEKNVNFLIVSKGNSYTIYDLSQTQNESYLSVMDKTLYPLQNAFVRRDILP